jgi:hypothetical protein
MLMLIYGYRVSINKASVFDGTEHSAANYFCRGGRSEGGGVGCMLCKYKNSGYILRAGLSGSVKVMMLYSTSPRSTTYQHDKRSA